ncbi:MAG: hypothetical protein R3B45_12025 [Bdellovibrionota bacterium]
MIQNSLTAVRPVLQSWFGKALDGNFIVISSAVSFNPSFANFITNAIELQTMGQGYRDLFWHEYTHTNMYLHLQNFFGPAGALFHLVFMPAWFIEGLAEAMSVSSGADVQVAIERYQALNDKWPSFDKLHSLYASSSSDRGYATSGAFVSWLLKQGNAEDLPKLLEDFYDYTMPWWWAWTLFPFNGFTPMDAALERYASFDSESLFEQYKAQAKAYWQMQNIGNFLMQRPGVRIYPTSLGGMRAVDNDVFFLVKDDGEVFVKKGRFDADSGWLTGYSSEGMLVNNDENMGYILKSSVGEFALKEASADFATGATFSQIIHKPLGEEDWVELPPRVASIEKIFLSEEKLFWLGKDFEFSKFCWLSLQALQETPHCVMERLPSSLQFLGERNSASKFAPSAFVSEEIWLLRTEQTLQGDRYELWEYNVGSGILQKHLYLNGGRPISLAIAGKEKWLLVGGTQGRSLRKIDGEGHCLVAVSMVDLPLKIAGLADGDIVFGLYNDERRQLLKISPRDLQQEACFDIQAHTSPLLYAMNQSSIPSLSEALKATDPWKLQIASHTMQQNIISALPLDQATLPFPMDSVKNDKKQGVESRQGDQAETYEKKVEDQNDGLTGRSDQSVPYEWQARPIFLFPFIGADDALGNQYGFVTVPLMDHLQNETVRASVLYGDLSHYPNTDITLTSTRYWPTLSLSIFRKQTWNGTFYSTVTQRLHNIYYDEKGASFESSFPFRFFAHRFGLSLGVRVSNLKSFIGPFRVREGQVNEPSLAFNYYTKLGEVGWSTYWGGRFTLEEMNSNFDYNVLYAGTSIGFSPGFLDSTIKAGVSGSRTRGKKMRALKEVYTPLKTFIPGSGGGYNQNSFKLTQNSSLTTSRFGDSKVRSNISWSFPVIKDIDKWLTLVYLERLDFTSFINYGGAWFGSDMPDQDKLIGAHGYNLDLQLDNKGVRFNLGAGTGQVFGEPFDVYLTFGFDALF